MKGNFVIKLGGSLLFSEDLKINRKKIPKLMINNFDRSFILFTVMLNQSSSETKLLLIDFFDLKH